MTIRWKPHLMLALAALTVFCSVPLPNVPLPSFVVGHLVKPSTLQAALQGYCRGQARMMQFMVSLADADVTSLEALLWDPLRQPPIGCGEWRSYVDFCRDQARTVQAAISASANPTQLEAGLWGTYPSQYCGEWRSYVSARESPLPRCTRKLDSW
jgi:hypothetical protein